MYSMYFVFSYFICPVYCSIDTNACQYVRIKKLLLHGYSTFDVPKSETSHGMVILVHKDIPSDLAQQFIFGPQTESLTIRIWIRGTSYLIHNIYNNGTTVNLSAAPSNERSMFLGDFKAHHASWCTSCKTKTELE